MTDFRKLLDLVEELSEPMESIELYDNFDIELDDETIVETGIVGFTQDGVIVEGDDMLISILEQNQYVIESTDISEKMIMGQSTDAAASGTIDEAEYQGRKVQLNKPMAGDVKKSKVYVKKPNGKIVKVNFGDKKMRIKKSNPKRRKSFRARHHCENPGPKWKARYWSCRAW